MIPLFSICMPVYNAGQYLAPCLDSILNQTFGDFELLVCDDKSTDGSLSILEQRAVVDSRIHIFRNETNQGVLTTRNHLFRMAQGKYSMWMDDDDTLALDFFQLAAEAFQEYDCDILEFPYEIVNPDGSSKYITRPDMTIEMEHLTEFFFAKMRPYAWYMWSKFFRTEVMKASIPPDSREILDDVFYGLQLFYNAKAYRWKETGHPMYHYRFANGSWSSLDAHFNLESFRKVCSMRAHQLAYNLSFAAAKKFPMQMMLDIADYADLRSVVNTLKTQEGETHRQALEIFFQFFCKDRQLVNGANLPLDAGPLLNTMRLEQLI